MSPRRQYVRLSHRRSDPRRRHATNVSRTDTDLQAALKATRVQGRGRIGQARSFRPDIDRGLRLGGGRPEGQTDRCVTSRVIDLRLRFPDGQRRLGVMRPWHDDEVASLTGADRRRRSKICRCEITIRRALFQKAKKKNISDKSREQS